MFRQKYLAKLLFIAAFVGLFSHAGAQADYYYYHDQQITITKNPTRKYILLSQVTDEIDLRRKLNIPDLQIHEFGSTNYLKQLNTQPEDHHEYYYAVIEHVSLPAISLRDSAYISYEGPFYKNTGNVELGLSGIFYVQLENMSDSALLDSMAHHYNLTVLGNRMNLPLWYAIACNELSILNALEASKVFKESALFPNAEPLWLFQITELCQDDDPNCADDPLFPDQWALENDGVNTPDKAPTPPSSINVCGAWKKTKGDASIIVAVLDEGIQPDHPDLTNIHGFSYNAMTGASPSTVYSAHGTKVAGVIGAGHNTIGISGVAPECPIMDISVSFAASVTASQLADAVDVATANGAAIINISSGWIPHGLTDAALDNALTAGRNGLGCVVIAAAGNQSGGFDPDSVLYPAKYSSTVPDEGLIAVGNMEIGGTRANNNSSFGSQLDIMAPGSAVWTTDLGSTYSNSSGTSIASPQAAAIAGLILSVNSCLTQYEVFEIIGRSARRIRTDEYNYQAVSGRAYGTWNNQMGYGLVDAEAALKLAEESSPVSIEYEHDNGTGGYVKVVPPSGMNLTYVWSHDPLNTTNQATGLEAGTYRVRMTDASGCFQVRTVEICNIDLGPALQCPGHIGPANLIPDATYEWSLANSAAFDESNKLYFIDRVDNPLANPMVPTTYILTIKDLNGNVIGQDNILVNVRYDLDNYTVTSSQQWNYQDKKIRGLLKVETGVRLTLVNSTLAFGPYITALETPDLGTPGFGIWVDEGAAIDLHQSRLQYMGEGCNDDFLWRGIEVWGSEDSCVKGLKDCKVEIAGNPGGGKDLFLNKPIPVKDLNEDMMIGFVREATTGNFMLASRAAINMKRPAPTIFTGFGLASGGTDLTNPDQGKLEKWGKIDIYESEISDAFYGIRANRTKPFHSNIDHSNFGGAQITADKTSFQNCLTGIQIANAVNKQRSVIRECSFRYTKPVNGYESAGIAVLLNDNTGVQIINNEFNVVNFADYSDNPSGRSTAIKSHDASYQVIYDGTELTSLTGPGNLFHGFYKGIDAYSSGGLSHIWVRANKFINNVTAITCNGSSFDEISRNVFNIPEGTLNELSYGVFMEGCKDYSIAENEFYSASTISTPVPPFGIVCNNSGNAPAEVYDNRFSPIAINAASGIFQAAVQVKGVNNLLEINCNRFEANNYADLEIEPNAVLGDMGICQAANPELAMSNYFHSSGCAIGTGFDIANYSATGFTYYSLMYQEPECVFGNVTVKNCPFLNNSTCPARVGTNASAEINLKEDLLNGINLAEFSNRRKMENTFIRELIQKNHLNQALDIINYREDAGSKQILATEYLRHGFYSACADVCALIDHNEPGNQDLIGLITDLRAVYEQHKGAANELLANEESMIRGHLAGNTPAKTNAESFLSSYELEQYRRVPWQNDQFSPKHDDNANEFHAKDIEQAPAGDLVVDVYPNPSNSGIFHLKLNNRQTKVNVRIIDMLGQQAVVQPEITGIIDLSAKPKGVYFIRISNGTKEVARKIIYQ